MNIKKATLQTADTPEELENAPKIPVENVEITKEEAMAQLPPEVQGALGHVVPFRGMWIVRLPDLVVRQNGKDVKTQRYLSSNGEATRVFHTKEVAEAALEYYQQLMITRAVIREGEEKRKAEEAQKGGVAGTPEPKPEVTPAL